MVQVVERLALQASRTEREQFYNEVANGFFPGDAQGHRWPVVDRTCETKHGEPFHQLLIRIHDGPNYWFRNLRLLQLRIGLGLIDAYYFDFEKGTCPFSEVMSKIQAIKSIVGEEQLRNPCIPEMRLPFFQHTRPIHSNVAADAIRNRGLRARERRLSNQ